MAAVSVDTLVYACVIGISLITILAFAGTSLFIIWIENTKGVN